MSVVAEFHGGPLAGEHRWLEDRTWEVHAIVPVPISLDEWDGSPIADAPHIGVYRWDGFPGPPWHYDWQGVR